LYTGHAAWSMMPYQSWYTRLRGSRASLPGLNLCCLSTGCFRVGRFLCGELLPRVSSVVHERVV
jgi:hypothetical protein